MRYLFLLLFIVSSFAIQSQEKPKNGPYVKYYKNGQRKTSGQYKKKKKVGDWKEFYDSGELKRTYSYTKGKMDVEKKSYFKTGTIKTETIQVKGDKFFKEYFETGELFFEKKLNGGYVKEYYKNGYLKSEGHYSDNELTGSWKRYFESGELEWEVDYFNSYREGSYKQYYKNGQLKIEGVNKKDKIDGLEKRYCEDGKLQWEGRYVKGELEGKWNGYDAFGTQIYNHKYKNGQLLIGSNVKLLVTNIPEGLIENAPIYPSCENVLGFKNQKKCMSENVAKHVLENFNTMLAARLGLEGMQKIYVIFKIDKTGDVTCIRARAPHTKLEVEAIRVIKKLPKMKPGMQRGKPVIVPYSLPIIFMVQGKKKKNGLDDSFFKRTGN